MQLSQLLNMTVPTSPIQGKSVTSDSGNKEGENNLFDSLLEMYLSPDKLAKSNALQDGLSGKKANEISEEKFDEKFEGKFDEKSIDLIKAISNLNSEDFINEIKDALKSAEEKTIFFFDNNNGNSFKELVPNLGISQKEINNLVQFISSMNLDNKKDIILDLGKSSLSKSKIIEFVQNNNFIFKQDDKNILTFKKGKNGQFLVEQNPLNVDRINILENKNNDNISGNKDVNVGNNKLKIKENDIINKLQNNDLLNSSKLSKDINVDNASNNRNLSSKNLYHLNEFYNNKSSKKILAKDNIESAEDILFLKNKFNNKKPNLNSLNKYMQLSDHENIKGAKVIDGSEKFNFAQKSQGKNSSINGNFEVKAVQNSKNENTELLMSMDRNESSEAISSKASIPSNKIANINKEFSITKTVPLEIASENNSLEALANRVGEYIKGHYNKSDENLSLTVKHDLIGKFKLDVTENADKTIDIKILTGSDDGKLFFARNESEISNNLKNLGLKISEMKIIAGSDSMNESNNSFDSEKNNSSENGKGSKYSNQDESKKDDSDRRKELWERYKERMDS